MIAKVVRDKDRDYDRMVFFPKRIGILAVNA